MQGLKKGTAQMGSLCVEQLDAILKLNTPFLYYTAESGI
jgi:hypothetical protein